MAADLPKLHAICKNMLNPRCTLHFKDLVNIHFRELEKKILRIVYSFDQGEKVNKFHIQIQELMNDRT